MVAMVLLLVVVSLGEPQYCIDKVVGCFDDRGSARQLPHALALNNNLTQSQCASACNSFCKRFNLPSTTLHLAPVITTAPPTFHRFALCESACTSLILTLASAAVPAQLAIFAPR